MATKRCRRGVWEYRIQRAGLLERPIYLSFSDEAEGDTYVRRIEQLLDRGIVPEEFNRSARSTPTRLHEFIADYQSTQSVSEADAGYLRVVRDTLPAVLPLRAVTFTWASDWVTSLKRDDNLAPSTIRHRVGALARCLDYVVAKGDMPVNPLRQLPRGYSIYTDADRGAVESREGGRAKADRWLDRRLVADEETRIRAVLAGDKPEGRQRPFELKHAAALRTLFDLALETAMRLSEMYTLHRNQIDFRARTIFLTRTKNGDQRQVPMSSVAIRVLEGYLAEHAGDRIFPWWSGVSGVAERRRCTSLLSRQFARIFDAAGCGDLRFHDLRHEATSRIFERTTLTDLQIAKITGHRDIRMLSRYANLRGSDLAARLW